MIRDVLAELVEEFPSGVGVWEITSDDPGDAVFLYSNKQTSIESGVDLSQFIGKTLREAFPSLLGAAPEVNIPDAIRRAHDTGEVQYITELPYGGDGLVPDGWFEVRIIPIEGKVAVIYENITVRRRLEQRLKQIAMEDPVTGLYNLRGFRRHLRDALNRAERSKKLVAVMAVDLDGFKQINDTHGHDAGDAALCNVGKRIRNVVRKVDHVARLGGDEFGIALEGVMREHDAMFVADKIVSSIGELPGISASVGVTTALFADESIDLILRQADIAMYRSKNLGGNTSTLYASGMTKDV